MSEATPSLSLEDKIAKRIDDSSLGIADATSPASYGVYISNPVETIPKPSTGAVGKAPSGMKKTPYLDSAPSWDLLRPDPLPPDKKKALGAQGNLARDERIKYYLDWGNERARSQPFTGVCESFNCIVIAVLMASNSPLPVGEVIEYIGVRHTAVGHALCVIRRDNRTEDVGQSIAIPPSASNTLDAWGSDCIVVDQWYALQAGCKPVFHVAGAQANEEYVKWLKSGSPAFTVCGRFTVGAPKRPSIPASRTERPY